jgi:hypothetical protein
MLSTLKLEGSNALQICEGVSHLRHLSHASIAACLRVLEVQKKSSSSVARVALEGYLEFANLTSAEKAALGAIASALNISAH